MGFLKRNAWPQLRDRYYFGCSRPWKPSDPLWMEINGHQFSVRSECDLIGEYMFYVMKMVCVRCVVWFRVARQARLPSHARSINCRCRQRQLTQSWNHVLCSRSCGLDFSQFPHWLIHRLGWQAINCSAAPCHGIHCTPIGWIQFEDVVYDVIIDIKCPRWISVCLVARGWQQSWVAGLAQTYRTRWPDHKRWKF